MGAGPAPGRTLGASSGHQRKDLLSRAASCGRDTAMNTPTTNRSRNTPELELSPMSRKVKHFDKYSRKGGRWSWKRPSYERDVVSLVKAERRIEEGIASALTEVEAVEAGLRYFDELIMPESKKIPPGATTEAAMDNTNSRSQATSLRGKVKQTRSNGRLEGGRTGKEKGGFSKSQEEKLREYTAARKTVVGPGSVITSSSDRAVAECVDLKLTLKQRLDNYDRQRGINTDALRSDSFTTAPSVPVIEGKRKGRGQGHRTDGNNNTSGSTAPIAADGSRKGHEIAALAPCCDGGVLDAGGVGQILSRSLGKAAASVRRNKSVGRDSDIIGSSYQEDGPAARSRWQSWNEAPPPALLGAGRARNVSAAQNEDGKHPNQTPTSEVVTEDVTPFNSNRRRAKWVGRSSSSTSSAADGKIGSAVEACAASVSSVKRLPGANDKRIGGTAGEAPSSAASSSSSRRSNAVGGVPLVPRVAMLAAAARATGNNDAEAARKGKNFDPDQLECVRRHEASVAERMRRVRNMRTEADKKTIFRARPLPAFLDVDEATADPDRGFLSSRGDGSTGRKGDGRGRSQAAGTGSGIAGTSPELLEALEQDAEARELVEKIRKINPRVDIASIVLQATPRTSLPSQPTTRTSDNTFGVPRRPSSRGAIMTGTSTAVASASSALPMSADAPPSSSMSTTAWEPRKTVAHGKQHPLPPSVGPDRATSSAAMTRKLEEKALASEGEKAVPRSAARGEALPCSQDHDTWKELDGGDRLPPGEGSSDGLRNQQAEGVPRQENQRESTISGAEEHGVEREGGEGGGDRGAGRSRRRSLMGRMLESGMLERQKEWAKARRRKVMESRRQVEEAKEQEGKGDVLDAGLSSRSWSKAKTQHLRSLERQRQEEEEREAIREARRRASAFRAERELEAAERRAAEIAKNLADAEEAMGAVTGIRSGRGGRTAPDSRGGGGELRSRRLPPAPPRRATGRVGNGGAIGNAEGGESTEFVASGDRQRGTEETYSSGRGNGDEDDPSPTVEANAHLSEDSFYRVAVEKIMEKERLDVGVGDAGGGGGGGDGGGNDGRRSSVPGRRHGRARKGAAGDPSVFASPRDVAVGRRSRRKPAMAPRHRRQGSGVNAGLLPYAAAVRGRKPSGACPTNRESSHTPRMPETSSFQSHSTVQAASYPIGGVARTSSLLSLYEAQSVEYPSDYPGRVHRDNSGPYLDNDYRQAPLDVGRSVSESGAQAFVETEWPDDGVQNIAKSAGGDSRTVATSAAAPAWSASGGVAENASTDRNASTRTAETDYPWSDERRAPWSSGSSSGPCRGGTGYHQIDVGSAVVDKEAGRDSFLVRGESTCANDIGARSAEAIARPQQDGTGSGCIGNEGRAVEAMTPNGYSNQYSPLGAARPQPSPRKQCSLERWRTGDLDSGAIALTQPVPSHAAGGPTENRSAGTEHLQLIHASGSPHGIDDDGRGLDGSLGGGGGGGRFSLWSSSDEDATITEINCHDEEGGGNDRNRCSDRELQGCEGGGVFEGNDEADWHTSRAYGECGHVQTPGRQAFYSAAASAGAFFDAATSSADKGRFKVRDPRLFDPCSMRRRPDVDVKSVHLAVLASGGGFATSPANHADGGRSSSTGVTLLLGCQADPRYTGDARKQEPLHGGEQVITVMFDRSKFNEEEAHQWWLANRARIEEIGEPRVG